MINSFLVRPSRTRATTHFLWSLILFVGLLGLSACANKPVTQSADTSTASDAAMSTTAPNPDPRVGLGAGLFDAEEAAWNVRLLSTTPPPEAFVGVTNSDLAFTGKYAIQGNYNGIQVWDISDPTNPELVTAYAVPASASAVPVYNILRCVSGDGVGCGL